jgi:two-component system, cell cycle response regulator DivK
MANESILIIDDNPSNVKLARLLLENAGYEVRTAGDSQEALETLQSFSPRLILMDIQLPGIDGLKLTGQLKQLPLVRDSIIVAVTAYAMRGDEERARAAGCDGYMCKPINTRTFVDQLRKYLEKSAGQIPGQKSGSSDPSDLLRELRNGFIVEGVESSRRYAEADLSFNDIDNMQRAVHHWVGMGGTLGFPEITGRARELEELLKSLPDQWHQRVGVALVEMYELFGRCTETMGETRVPIGLVENLASKQIGLVGFSDNESERVRAAFDQVHAVARDLGALSNGLGLEALHAHDLIILNTCTQEGIRSCESVLAEPLLKKPVLLVSSRSALQDSKLALLDRAADFVAEPWDSEELLCRAQRLIGQKSRTQPPQTRNEKKPIVVIADDDPMIPSLLTPMLNRLGIDCHSARDGRQALDAVSNLTPDGLVLDIGMPRISGMSVLREIRKAQQNGTVRILVLSARSQPTHINMALALGADDYAVKPFNPEDVVMRLVRLLRLPAPCMPDGG